MPILLRDNYEPCPTSPLYTLTGGLVLWLGMCSQASLWDGRHLGWTGGGASTGRSSPVCSVWPAADSDLIVDHSHCRGLCEDWMWWPACHCHIAGDSKEETGILQSATAWFVLVLGQPLSMTILWVGSKRPWVSRNPTHGVMEVSLESTYCIW